MFDITDYSPLRSSPAAFPSYLLVVACFCPLLMSPLGFAPSPSPSWLRLPSFDRGRPITNSNIELTKLYHSNSFSLPNQVCEHFEGEICDGLTISPEAGARMELSQGSVHIWRFDASSSSKMGDNTNSMGL